MRKSWESQEAVRRESWNGHKEVYYSTSVVISYWHVGSCMFARCPHNDHRVAIRPWLTFQAKGHGCQKADRKVTESCQKVVRKWSESCQKVARMLPENSQKIARKMPESCQKVVRKLPKICQKVSRKLPKICQKVAIKLPKNCQKVVRKLPESHETVMMQSWGSLLLYSSCRLCRQVSSCLFVRWWVSQ